MLRTQALRSASEEYSHILDVLQRYAVYSAPRTAFNCRRHGDTRPDLVTTANAAAAAAAATAAANGAPPNPMLRLDAVRAVYGADVTRELLPLVVAAGGSTGPEVPVDGPMGLRVEVRNGNAAAAALVPLHARSHTTTAPNARSWPLDHGNARAPCCHATHMTSRPPPCASVTPHPHPTPPPTCAQGLISGANYVSGKKTVLVFFINGRAVDCPPLRRTLEGLYGSLLPKAARPWLFLDVRLPPRHVEVNMHPTKREVGFLHQVGRGGWVACWMAMSMIWSEGGREGDSWRSWRAEEGVWLSCASGEYGVGDPLVLADIGRQGRPCCMAHVRHPRGIRRAVWWPLRAGRGDRGDPRCRGVQAAGLQ